MKRGKQENQKAYFFTFSLPKAVSMGIKGLKTIETEINMKCFTISFVKDAID